MKWRPRVSRRPRMVDRGQSSELAVFGEDRDESKRVVDDHIRWERERERG